jgi:6-phosphofructokinase 2
MNEIVTLTLNPALDLSTTIEEMRPFSKLRCSGERRDAGGGGINVARVATRLGASPLAIFPAGGPIGRYLADIVAAEGVRSLVIPIQGNTREDVTVTEAASSRQFRFVMAGPPLAESEWEQVLSECILRLHEGTYLVASGSLAPGMPDDFYARLAAAAKARGARLLLDSSGAALEKALAEGVYLIKPNLRELRGLTREPLPDRDAWLAASRRLVASGAVEIVALSLAELGALFVTRDLALYAKAPAVEARSTVGTGDSFLGALVAKLAGGENRRDAFRAAVAAGTAALLAPGTELGKKADIERLMALVTLVEV